MNTQHTPGPWSFHKSNEYDQFDFVVNNNRLDPEKGEGICMVFTGKPENEDEANARLIAAAPELLEAIFILLEDNGYDITQSAGGSHRTQKVIAAIKKATE